MCEKNQDSEVNMAAENSCFNVKKLYETVYRRPEHNLKMHFLSYVIFWQ